MNRFVSSSFRGLFLFFASFCSPLRGKGEDRKKLWGIKGAGVCLRSSVGQERHECNSKRLLSVGCSITSLESQRDQVIHLGTETFLWRLNESGSLLTWQGFYRLSGGMQGADRGPLVLEGHPGPVWAPVTVNQDLVTVLRLDEGPSLGMDVDVDEFLKAPLVGFTVETRDQLCLGGVLVQELWAFNKAAFRDWTVWGGQEKESVSMRVLLYKNDPHVKFRHLELGSLFCAKDLALLVKRKICGAKLAPYTHLSKRCTWLINHGIHSIFMTKKKMYWWERLSMSEKLFYVIKLRGKDVWCALQPNLRQWSYFGLTSTCRSPAPNAGNG